MVQEQAVDYNRILNSHFFRIPGEHMLVGGQTGSGKTQAMYWVLANLLQEAPKETVIWFDTGKTAELLMMAKFLPVRLLIPLGGEVEIELAPDTKVHDIEVKYFVSTKNLFNLITTGRINIVCLRGFYREPEKYAVVLSTVFEALINLALDYALPTPLAVFVDEFHLVAPGQGHALTEEHNKAGKFVQLNLDLLRSTRVRIVASTQSWTKIRKGCRDSFNWLLIKRNMHFGADKPRLRWYNQKWQFLKDDEAVIVFPDQIYTDKLILPFYGDGRSLGRVRYLVPSDEGRAQRYEADISLVAQTD